MEIDMYEAVGYFITECYDNNRPEDLCNYNKIA